MLAASPATLAAAGAEAVRQTLDAMAPHWRAPPAGVRSLGHDSLSAFYAARQDAPLWTTPDRLRQLHDALADVINDGLDPQHYALDAVRAMHQHMTTGATLPVCDELKASFVFLQALHHLSGGMLERDRLEPLWQPHTHPAPAGTPTWWRAISHAGEEDISAHFAAARPDTRHYRGLREAHARWRLSPDTLHWPTVPPGAALREGVLSPRVPLLRDRLQREGFVAPADADQPLRFDDSLHRAVMAFQRAHQLHADGVVGPATLAVLNLTPAARLDTLRLNLERMRWLAGEQAGTQLQVNIASARLEYLRHGEVIWSARAQVGRSSRRTPQLASHITHLSFNPAWTVPPTIFHHDTLPAIRADLGYLARHDMQVLDADGRLLDPAEIDWAAPGNLVLRQAAGPHNPLGRVAIRFSNPFHVYLHDTPSQHLFESDQRTHSSGCVRVERALELAQLLIDDGSAAGASAAALSKDGHTRQFRLDRPLPILLAYWTADPATAGGAVFHADAYALDARLLGALRALPNAYAIMTACPAD